MTSKIHWENVYSIKATDSVSWFQPHATLSMQLIRETGIDQDDAIIDVGGGASTLVDDLVGAGFSNLTVLDLSSAALALAKARLGTNSDSIRWIEADITKVDLAIKNYDVWHDRAVFHFLTTKEDRQAYLDLVQQSVKNGGHVIIATFAEDGPTQCSGLPVMRYSVSALQEEFGSRFTLLRSQDEIHNTPFNTTQKFNYCYFQLD